MSEQDWSTKLAPALSVLDGIRPDAAKALRELIAEDHEALGNSHISCERLDEYIMDHIHWRATPQGGEFWGEVYNELEEYERKWFS